MNRDLAIVTMAALIATTLTIHIAAAIEPWLLRQDWRRK